MTKWEYCQVGMKYEYEPRGGELYMISKGLIAVKGENEIATGKYYIFLFNELGMEGWEMCGQNINGFNIHSNDVQTDVVYYFKREVT